MAFTLEALHRLRAHELGEALRHFPDAGRVLELGAGTGYQAQALAARGYAVEAIDLPQSTYSGVRVYPVRDYDGRHIPLPDHAVDVVFSSNVLEHVRDLDLLLAETRRVLKPGGQAVHLVPSPAWRFWTLITGAADIPGALWRTLVTAPQPGSPAARRSLPLRLARAVAGRLLPVPHGEGGNAFTELWTFRAEAWRRRFEAAGFAVKEAAPSGLFYTGYLLLGDRLSLGRRARLARLLGSACTLFVLTPGALPRL